MKIRKPYVANAFYEGTRARLTDQIEGCFEHKFGPGKVPSATSKGPRKVFGIISPHAGYMYSGPVAAHGFTKLAQDHMAETFVILGPNHTGYGSGVSILTDGGWETPFGVMLIHGETAKAIQKGSGLLDVDEAAHAYEHSVEVQLPFLQFLYKDSAKFVPICMMMQDLQTSRDVARSIVGEANKRDALIVASSDFTHYEPHELASRKDQSAIDAILRLDDAALNELGESNKVTMCGYGPITTLIAAARIVGGIKAELLCHKTSGDITGDKSSVVGYSSIVFYRE